MLKREEKTLHELFQSSMESEVSIVYKKEPGMDGNTTLRVSGFGPMLFDGACIILKKLAMADAKQCGDEAGAVRYVDLVRDNVVQEIIQETGDCRDEETEHGYDDIRKLMEGILAGMDSGEGKEN